MKAKGLVLPGYACTAQIWRSIRAALDAAHDMTWVDWPRELTAELHTVEAFADWLRPAIQPVNHGFVIGHSMGGLVALELMAEHKTSIRKVILIETFLRPPTPFFQNLFAGTALGSDERSILDMLEQEKPRYSSKLREALRQGDTGPLADTLNAEVHALYGDRGCGDPNRVERELAWPQELHDRVAVAVVSNACHFPMIENPEMTTRLLRAIIE